MIIQSNYVAFNTPKFRKLSDDQLERLHRASLEILDRTGVRLYEEGALDLNREAAVKRADGNRVHVPLGLLEWSCLTRSRIVLYNGAQCRWIG